MLTLLVEKARKISDKLFNEFNQMSRKILQRTNSIEELTQQKDFIATVPRLISGLKRKIQKMTVHYELIEKFNYPINQDDFEQKWQVTGWSKKIYQQMEESVSVQDRARKRFEKDLHVSQEAFNGALKEYQELTTKCSTDYLPFWPLAKTEGNQLKILLSFTRLLTFLDIHVTWLFYRGTRTW